MLARIHFHVRSVTPRSITPTLLVVAAALPRPVAAEDPNPILEFFGQRFAPAYAAEGAECVAFDATNRHVAGFPIVDACGTDVLESYGGSGTAWDPVLQKYWFLSPDGDVGTFVGSPLGSGMNGADKDTLFALPESVTLPGDGTLSVVSARGIAVDSTHVYVVTAGPAPGAASSGGWFKFTRDGTPVAHSGGTDFNANLIEDPDALVDGITWVPPGTPWAAGAFLVALEHSGIQMLDANGFYLDHALWSDDGFGFGDNLVPNAFAAIGIDPQDGDLLVVDNDRSMVQRWVRLSDEGSVSSYLLSNGWERAWIQRPTADGCSYPLTQKFAAPFQPNPLIFGIAYRSANGLVYGINFDDGDLYSFDPRLGRTTLVGSTGIPGIWGLAYDPDLDVFYAGEETNFDERQIWIVDPDDASPTALTFPTGHALTDLAYDPVGGDLWGTAWFSGNHYLVRIDPISGQGLFAGDPIPTVSGLTWDHTRDLLIGKTSGGVIWEIDPTGGSTVMVSAASTGGWEGLAFVFEGDAATGVPAPNRRAAADAGPRLTVAPNPFRESTSIRFDAPRSGPFAAAIHDVRGRRIRSLAAPTGGALTSIRWDGRNDRGDKVSAGVYFVRLETSTGTGSARVLLRR